MPTTFQAEMTEGKPTKRKAPTEREITLSKRLFGKGFSDSEDSDEEDVGIAVETDSDQEESTTNRAIWRDEDDDEGEIEIKETRKNQVLKKDTDPKNAVVSTREYEQRLRDAFVRTKTAGKQPKWMQNKEKGTPVKKYDSDSDEDANEVVKEMTKTAMSYVEKDARLCKGKSEARLLKDITQGHRDHKPLSLVRFHRSKPLLFTAGSASAVKMFTVDSDAKSDHFVRSVQFKKFPITSLEITEGGTNLLMGSAIQEYILKCDVETGQFSQLRLPRCVPHQNCGRLCVSRDSQFIAMAGRGGQVYVISLSSMEHVKTFSARKDIVSLQFSAVCYDELWAITESGEIFIWRVLNNDTHVCIDHGAVKGTHIALSRDAGYVATGSNTGIVNLYQATTLRASKEPQPVFVLKNIVTEVSCLSFNHDAQILAAGSKIMSNSLRGMHVQTGRVLTDIPARFEKIPGISSIDFSPNSGYMAVGCMNGTTRLYELGHFDQY